MCHAATPSTSNGRHRGGVLGREEGEGRKHGGPRQSGLGGRGASTAPTRRPPTARDGRGGEGLPIGTRTLACGGGGGAGGGGGGRGGPITARWGGERSRRRRGGGAENEAGREKIGSWLAAAGDRGRKGGQVAVTAAACRRPTPPPPQPLRGWRRRRRRTRGRWGWRQRGREEEGEGRGGRASRRPGIAVYYGAPPGVGGAVGPKRAVPRSSPAVTGVRGGMRRRGEGGRVVATALPPRCRPQTVGGEAVTTRLLRDRPGVGARINLDLGQTSCKERSVVTLHQSSSKVVRSRGEESVGVLYCTDVNIFA